MVKREGEVWHLHKILDTLQNKPKTQMYICKKSRLHHHKLDEYLKKLQKLGFVVQSYNYGNHNVRAKLWKSTPSGDDFKSILQEYVKVKT